MCKQNQKLISRIISNEEEFNGQERVSKGITKFYKELYMYKPTENGCE